MEALNNVTYARFEKRLLALLIDLIVIFILSNVFLKTVSMPNHLKEDITEVMVILNNESSSEEDKNEAFQYLMTNPEYWNMLRSSFFIIIMVNFLYFYFSWAKYSVTIGKKLTNCKIIDAETGKDAKPLQLLLRLILAIPSVGFLGLGYVFMHFTEKRQALHDIVCGTTVVNIKTHS